MKNKKADIMFFFILFLLIIILFFFLYLLYNYFPSDSDIFEIESNKSEFGTVNLTDKIIQFYPNMKFNHNNITFSIDSECPEENKARMIQAFSILEQNVPKIGFIPAEQGDIRISCTKKVETSSGRSFFIAGEGGAEQIIQTERYNIITKGTVLLYENPRGSLDCSWPNLELHELMHVFGFQHSVDKESLMYGYIESCDQKLDESIILDLNELYNQDNLPDLYFESLKAVKSGRYLDFNSTIKNSGAVGSKGVELGIYDGEEKIESFELGDIDFGAGVTFSVSNVKLKSRNSDNIRLFLEPANRVIELYKDNNIAILSFNS